MSKIKRYVLTGGSIIVGLIVLVSVARYAQSQNPFSKNESRKKKGPEKAPIHLEIFSDFQCPACAAAVKPEVDLEKEFGEKIRVEFYHYPLESIHRWALLAAIISECVAQEGKFWPLHDRLFQEQKTWASSMDPAPLFSKYASELGIDPKKLDRCLDDPKVLEQIRKDQKTGKERNVRSTPTMFLNGRMLVGAKQLEEQGRTVILEELKKSEKTGKS